MGALARAARSGISPSQRRSAASLARDGRVSMAGLGANARAGGRLAGIGLPPALPQLMARTAAPRINASAGGADAFHASPMANPISARSVRGAPEFASSGYGPSPAPRALGSPMQVVRGGAPVGRFIGGSPEMVSSGYGSAPRPSGLASAPSAPPLAPVSRFVDSRAEFAGPAGRFI